MLLGGEWRQATGQYGLLLAESAWTGAWLRYEHLLLTCGQVHPLLLLLLEQVLVQQLVRSNLAGHLHNVVRAGHPDRVHHRLVRVHGPNLHVSARLLELLLLLSFGSLPLLLHLLFFSLLSLLLQLLLNLVDLLRQQVIVLGP